MALTSTVRMGALSTLLVAGLGIGQAQSAANPTSDDKDFLKDTVQDSNYEIKTGQLALQKSPSADVKAYATTLIQDHTKLRQEAEAAEKTAGVDPTSMTSMTVSDTASYTKLKLLSGKSFDESYLKGLTKGNEDSIGKAKSEAAGSAVPSIKKLAAHRVALDTKHTEKAQALAQAHGVQ